MPRTALGLPTCYNFAYGSQSESSYFCDIEGAELGGSTVMSEAFPDKPKGMHWRTYDRLRHRHDFAEKRSMMGLMQYIDRQDRRAGARH